MTNQTHKKILLAVDGSDRAFETVRYVSKITPFQEMQVVLFTVFNKIPESYWDLERNPLYGQRLREIRAWETTNEMAIKKYMDEARQKLLDSGFSKDGVAVKIHERKRGIARDIISESRTGYSAVIVGRKGMSKVKDLVLGSVAAKLIEKITSASLLVVGRNVEPGRILLALDPSEGAMRAVDYVCATLNNCDFCEMRLIHVIRGESDLQSGNQKLFSPKERIEEAQKAISSVFDEAKNRLIKSGFESDQLTAGTIIGAHSRAGAIVEEAKRGGYGTIVVGRRGLSKVSEFFMGRVSNKVIQLAKEHAVWVVN